MNKLPKTVDVVIPVYNAFDYLERCIKSIQSTPAGYPFRLILINDTSTDPRVGKFLNSIKSKEVIILKNKINVGFVGTCNKGMKYSRNDVLLLNQDTEVTRGWLQKMVACAYSNEKIATVSPFFNSGTGLFNVPDHYKNNKIPEGHNLKSWASTIEQISDNSYPEMLVNVGTCFYIKRSVINEIGVLDEKAFKKGYGEETDFCLRANRRGYKHVISDNTFILHEGSKSYEEHIKVSDQRKALVERNTKIINRRYPEFQKWLDAFLVNDPLTEIHQNIWFHTTFFSKKKRFLVLGSKEAKSKSTNRLVNKYKNFDVYLSDSKKGKLSISRLSTSNPQKLTLKLPETFSAEEAALILIRPDITLNNGKEVMIESDFSQDKILLLNKLRIRSIVESNLKSSKYGGKLFDLAKRGIKKISVATRGSFIHKPLRQVYTKVKSLLKAV